MYHIRHAYEHGMQQLNRCFDMAAESGYKAVIYVLRTSE